MKINFHKKKKNFEKTRNVIDDNSRFAVIEGYKIARTNLMFSLAAYERKCIAFTSWSKGEGKSTATAQHGHLPFQNGKEGHFNRRGPS